jgi:hypothetical protein
VLWDVKADSWYSVQLHNGLGYRCTNACSEVGFSSQNGDRAWVCYWRAVFYGQKDSVQRISIKKCFLFTVGSVYHIKPWWETFHLWGRGWNGGTKVSGTVVKRLVCCWFRCTGRPVGQMYQCWWRICWEINVFSRFEFHVVYVLYPFVTYLPTLPHMSI